MTLTQLQVFLKVVETGNFTLAAGQLYMTQSAVSHAIASLERELGVILLQRQRTGVTMTSVGEQVLMHARVILDQVECIQQETAEALGRATGKLRLGSVPSVSKGVLPPLLGSFRRSYPGIAVTLLEGTDQEVYDWLVSRAVDISVVTLPADGVETISLATDEMIAVLPADHVLAKNVAIQVEQIASDPFIMSKGGCEPLIRTIFERVGLTPRVAFEASDTEAILAMVQEGLGVTVVPQLSLSATSLHASVLPLDPPIYRRLGLAVRSHASLSPAMKAFLRHVE
ncbi:MAG TPA: LysR family transcriptional regulator, partial [Ktedonobacteraceae bacterium]